METIKPRKNFNFEEDRESIDRVIESYMADTLKVLNCQFVVKKSNSSWIIDYWRIISLDTLAITKMIVLKMQNQSILW